MNSMDNKRKALKFLYILPYRFSEDLFYKLIGTKELLDDFINSKQVSYTIDGIEANQKINIDISDTEKIDLHKICVDEYYLPIISNAKIVDYNDFRKYYNDYFNLIYHLSQSNRYDEVVLYISDIASKMQYWGKKKELRRLLDNIDINKLEKNNKYLLIYYRLFTKITSFDSVDNEDVIEKEFDYLNSAKDFNQKIYFESKNLRGIYYRIYLENIEMAIKIYKEAILEFDDNKAELSSVYGKIYENLSFCYHSLEKIDEEKDSILNAIKYLEKSNDKYELAKMYCYGTINYKKRNNNQMFLSSFNKLFELIKNHSFPDIERILFNFLAKIQYTEYKNVKNYFQFKTHALDCGLVLYPNYFIDDYIAIYKFIKENKKQYKDQIIEGLKYPKDLLEHTPLENEKLFLNLLSSYLKGETYTHIKDKISNQTLLQLFDDLISEVSE